MPGDRFDDPQTKVEPKEARKLLYRLLSTVAVEQRRTAEPAVHLTVEVDGRVVDGDGEWAVPAGATEIAVRDELGTVRVWLDPASEPFVDRPCDQERLLVSWSPEARGRELRVRPVGEAVQRVAAASATPSEAPWYRFTEEPSVEEDGVLSLEAICDPRLAGRRVQVEVRWADGAANHFEARVTAQGVIRVEEETAEGRAGFEVRLALVT